MKQSIYIAMDHIDHSVRYFWHDVNGIEYAIAHVVIDNDTFMYQSRSTSPMADVRDHVALHCCCLDVFSKGESCSEDEKDDEIDSEKSICFLDRSYIDRELPTSRENDRYQYYDNDSVHDPYITFAILDAELDSIVAARIDELERDY